MASPKISLRGVTKAFGATKVLQGIDVDVAPA
jgi:ABC-type transporter Mla maintaining outer membrane lipid asymmetry ATPase subunit MlaF